MRLKSSIFFILLFLASAAFTQSVNAEYLDAWVNIKINQELRSACFNDRIENQELNRLFERFEVDLIAKKFPHTEPFIKSRAAITDKQDKRVDLSLIYKVHFKAGVDPKKVSSILNHSGLVVYAEPWYIDKPIEIPNDALIGDMWHLPVINAFDAWDIETGSSDVTIAIVDSGVDWDHPDLVDAIKINQAELNGIAGVDDDNNGYVDDIRGWNFYNDNNDPDELGFSHGTHVAGLAGATANNNYGVAGTGRGCKILAVKTGDKLQIPFGYEGVVYAADNGADVINCSWGGFGRSETAHDVMKYATYNKDAVVFGGAGNDNRQNRFYPASYPEVMSVSASDSTNQKADFSNFNYDIDMIAPGVVIFSLKNGEFGYDSGTSMSAPIIAGAAGLIRSKFPTLSALQVMEQLRVSADPTIYEIEFNKAFEGKLGTGLLDMKKALEGINSPALRVTDHVLTDNDDDIFSIGEEFTLGVELFNYLNSISDLQVEITSLSENVQIVDGTWNVASIPTSSQTENFNTPFKLMVTSAEEFDQEVIVKLIASSLPNNYVFEHFFSINVNPSYVNVRVNNVKTTVSKNGLFGYTDYFQTNGLGFRLDTLGSLLYEGGLLIGHNSDSKIQVADRVRNGELFDRDFWEKDVISRQDIIGDEAFYAFGSFTDTSANQDEIGLVVEQRVLAYNKTGHENYVILEYEVENISDQDLTGVAIGLFADWDVTDPSLNKGATAYGKRLGYVYSLGEDGVAAGIQALSANVFNTYMIDNVGGGYGGVDIFDEEGFTSQDKYTAMTEERLEAGDGDLGNDVIQVTSVKGITIPKNTVIKVAFALHAARSIDELLISADSAYSNFNGYLPGENLITPFKLISIFPNPAAEQATISIDLKNEVVLNIDLLDAMGGFVKTIETETAYPGYNEFSLGLSNLETGVYFIRLIAGDFLQIFPIVVQEQ